MRFRLALSDGQHYVQVGCSEPASTSKHQPLDPAPGDQNVAFVLSWHQGGRLMLLQVMLATQLNERVLNSSIVLGTVLRVDECLANNVSGNR